MDLYKQLEKLLNVNLTKYKILFVLLFIITGIFEIAGIGIILIFVNSLGSIISGNLPNYIVNLIDYLDVNNQQFIVLISILIFLIFSFKNILLIFIEIFKFRFFAASQTKLSLKIYSSLINTSLKNLLKTKSHKLISDSVVEIDKIFQNYLQSIYIVYSETIIFVLVLLFLLFIEFKVSIILIFTFSIIVFLFGKIFKRKIDYWGKKRQTSISKLNKLIISSIRNFKEIKVEGLEEKFQEYFKKNSTGFANSIAFLNILQSIPRLFIEILIVSLISLLIIYSILFFDDYTRIFSILALFATSAIRLAPSANRIYVNANTKHFFEYSLKSIISQIDHLNSNIDNNKNKKKIIEDIENIELKNVKFAYDQKIILQNLNYKFKKGEMIAVTGPNGSGKSTFLDLILGLHKPSSGSVYINNKDINKIDTSNLFAYCTQDHYLVDDTIKKNLTMFQKKINFNIIKFLMFTNFFKNKNYLKIKTGEDGKQLSGGQRQIVLLAKNLLKNKQIIILDEPTAALNNKVKEKIFLNLNRLKKDKIILIVTHDTKFLKYFDKIIKIKKR